MTNDFASSLATVEPDTHVSLRINGIDLDVAIDPRVTLLDLLREHLHQTGAKKVAITASAGRARF
jgi:xanthine dehydrogenase YagT iron-sulfur-binding subunit